MHAITTPDHNETSAARASGASAGERFTDSLRDDNAANWQAVVGHRFVSELFDGSIDDSVMCRYLIQDHRFLDGFLALIGAAVASADRLDARLRLAAFAGDVAGDESTYFLRCFAKFGVSEADRAKIPDTAATAGFKRVFRDAADTRNYTIILSVLLVSEWSYLSWAMRAPEQAPASFVHAEWITLHDNPPFRQLVEFLRSELDRVGPAHACEAREFFGRTVQLELDFFDQSYELR
ncbi:MULTISPECIES: TenA family protein [unclassified Pseudoclavibacter]|uniref:TenA family protein n=1 Tax=unclassified Pseudoclavibacter TaxID=2615177 RepID=UPI0013017A0B|nr:MULTISPECIES: TenA family protein [unclassified Pseudoclavibacter]KAB1647432.1 TenA family transcriptional regulator [Pseudoclavibacter sp. CFCC 14310]KAB1663117.1 TenA family transcriptional regulator [Pseudoclavibacter sp. CFCC 13611]